MWNVLRSIVDECLPTFYCVEQRLYVDIVIETKNTGCCVHCLVPRRQRDYLFLQVRNDEWEHVKTMKALQEDVTEQQQELDA